MEMTATSLAFYGIALMSVVAFGGFAADKLQAIRGGRRVSERTLLLLALGGGLPGALVAMGLFRHKTAKTAFRRRMQLILLVWGVAGAAAIWYGRP